MLSRLSDMNFVQDLCEDLYEMFKVQVMPTPLPLPRSLRVSPANSCSLPLQTDKGFDKTMFERQMSVMRGQVSHFLCLSSACSSFSPQGPTSIVCSANPPPTLTSFLTSCLLFLVSPYVLLQVLEVFQVVDSLNSAPSRLKFRAMSNELRRL